MSFNSVSKTPIAYYGGKISLLSHILPVIPKHEVYTETFFGGGAVFFAKEPVKNETINDKLDICITFYKTLKSDFQNLKTLIDSTLVSRTQHLEALAIWNDPKSYSDLQQAWAFWLTCNFSFSNKPGGGYKILQSSDFSCSNSDEEQKEAVHGLAGEQIGKRNNRKWRRANNSQVQKRVEGFPLPRSSLFQCRHGPLRWLYRKRPG